jgi:hypothetical protein
MNLHISAKVNKSIMARANPETKWILLIIERLPSSTLTILQSRD